MSKFSETLGDSVKLLYDEKLKFLMDYDPDIVRYIHSYSLVLSIDPNFSEFHKSYALEMIISVIYSTIKYEKGKEVLPSLN